MKKILEPRFNTLSVAQYPLGDVISVDVDADRANDSKFLSFDWDRCAFEFSRADVQLVIQFLFVEELPAFEINQQIRCAVPQMPARNIVFESDERVRGIRSEEHTSELQSLTNLVCRLL